MSSNLPPGPPPVGPPTGPPSGPPSGPPLGPPPTQAPELLYGGAGGRIPPPPGPPGSPGGGRRKGLLVGGAVVGLAAVAGGAFAFYQVVLATGPQPAEALPASTVGYVSVDLDPSGKQKLEALETLEKFPAFQDAVDVDADDDLRATLFDYVQDEGGCAGLDFGDDIEPWLGDRFAVAAVDVGKDLTGDDLGIAPVGVVQVDDADAAEAGLEKLLGCDGSGSDGVVAEDAAPSPGGPDGDSNDENNTDDDTDDAQGGYSIRGDWVVIAESTEIAEAVTDAAADDSLADDDDFQKWTEAAGDPGILTAYLAPDAGSFLVEAFGSFPFGGSSYACGGSYESSSEVEPAEPAEPGATTYTTGPDDDMSDPYDDYSDDFSDDDYTDYCTEDDTDADDEAGQALEDAFADFDGAAVTVRFGDGGLEVESASSVDYLNLDKIYSTDQGDDVVAGLPDDTAIAAGIGFEDGWFTAVTDYVESTSGGFFDIDDGIAEIERITGLQLPEDAETLAGESAALAVSGDVDFSADSPEGQPVGVKVQGDPDSITPILDKLLGSEEVGDLDGFAYQSDDDHVAGGFSDDWTARLLEGGDLGDVDAYQDVVEDSENAAAVVFVNFDQGDWLEKATDGDRDLEENLAPLDALGLSAWTDDDGVSHSVLRVTTD